MRSSEWLISFVLISGAHCLDLSLPVWSEESREVVEAEAWLPGASLLLGEAGTQPVDGTEVLPPNDAEMTEEDSASFVSEEFLEAYFADRPEGFLIDPQGLLDPAARRDRMAFLDYHSADSMIDFHVYLFGADQQIPGEVRKEEISQRLFGEGRPSLILFYYLGDPERSEIFLSDSLTDAVSDAERRRILKSSVLAALEKSDSISQLEAFCVQTSIRIYWIEKAAGLVVDPRSEPTTKVSDHAVSSESSRMEAFKKMIDVFWWHWGAIVSVSLVALIILITGGWIANRRAKYRFPEFEVAARLGGNHAAGIGAVIGFGSTTQSPSTQNSGVPDYFGGI